MCVVFDGKLGFIIELLKDIKMELEVIKFVKKNDENEGYIYV
jgi:hypothetical protein